MARQETESDSSLEHFKQECKQDRHGFTTALKHDVNRIKSDYREPLQEVTDVFKLIDILTQGERGWRHLLYRHNSSSKFQHTGGAIKYLNDLSTALIVPTGVTVYEIYSLDTAVDKLRSMQRRLMEFNNLDDVSGTPFTPANFKKHQNRINREEINIKPEDFLETVKRLSAALPAIVDDLESSRVFTRAKAYVYVAQPGKEYWAERNTANRTSNTRIIESPDIHNR